MSPTLKSDGAASAPPPERGASKRKRRWSRRLAWVLLGLAALTLVVVAIPWSPVFLKRLVEREMAQRLGCRVAIDRATVWLLWGQIRLNKLELDYAAQTDRFRFADLDRPTWRLGEAVVNVRPRQVLSRDREIGLQIVLRHPDPLTVATEKGSTFLFPPLGDLAGKRPKTGLFGHWRVSSMLVENGALEYLLPATDRVERNRATFSQLWLHYASDPENAKERFTISGRVGRDGESPFSGYLIRHGNLWRVGLQTNPIRFGGKGSFFAPFEGAVESILLLGQAQHQRGGGWDFQLTASCPRAEVLGVVEEKTTITIQGRMDEPTSRGMVVFDVSSRASHVTAALKMAFNGLEDSQTTVSVERLADGWFDLWNQKRPAHWPIIEARQQRLAVTAAARLLPSRPWIEQPRGFIFLSGVHLNSDYLPFVVRDVDLVAAVAPGRVEIRRCQGRWPRGWVALSGTHEGPWWPRREGTTRIAWACGLRAEDLLTTLPSVAETKMTTAALAALANRPLLEGDLSGSGTLILGWEGSKGSTEPTTRSLQGTVALRHGRITHPDFPAPITDIGGVLQVSPQRLQINPVQGQMLGTTATIGATIEGEPFFWSKPYARCLIHTDITIADAARLAPDPIRPTIERIEPQGSLTLWLSLAGPLRRPFRAQDIAATGTAVVRNLAFRSPTWALVGTFHDLQGQLDLANGVIRLTTATGRLERVPFSLRAEADPRAGRFWARLESSSPFRNIQQVMPRALSRYEVGGNTSGWFELEAWGQDLFQKISRLRGLTSATLANLPFQWDLRGEVFPRDVQMTLENFPTSLTEIVGRISLKKLEWTFDDLTSSWGKTEKCRIGGGGRFRPGSWPVMRIDLEAPVLYLDEWVRPWRRSHRARIPPRVANPIFELTGTLRGPRAFYRGHPGENFSGEFDLVAPYLNVDTFRFSNTSADLHGGRVTGQGRVIFKGGASTCTVELATQNVSLPQLIQCESGREQTFVGRLTGNGVFDWLNGDGATLTGHGHLSVAESKFLGNVFFRRLGQLIKIPFLDDVSFATIETPFDIAKNRMTFENLSMEGPMLSMSGHGSAGFDHTLDFVLELGFPRLPQYAWLLDLAIQYFGMLPATVFSLDLRGSWDDPQYEFHQLNAAQEGFLGALGQLWGLVTPSSPVPPPKPTP